MELNFKYWLVFSFGRVEVFEPVGFDASNFVCEQESKRFGRDTYYGSDDISLSFTDEKGSPLPEARLLDNGQVLRHYTSGLEFLLQENRNNGSESVVYFELEKDGVFFTTGQLDFGSATTDDETYFDCKVTQVNQQANIKRREKIKIDLFSDKDLDENTIDPIQTQKMLLQAKPVKQVSEWSHNGTASGGGASYLATGNSGSGLPTIGQNNAGVNTCNSVINYGIGNTLSFFSTVYTINNNDFPVDGLSFTYIEAETDLFNVTVNINDVIASSLSEIIEDNEVFTIASGAVRLVIKYGYDSVNGSDMETIVLYERIFGDTALGIEDMPTDYSETIPLIKAGQRVYIYAYATQFCTFDDDPFSTYRLFYNIILTMSNMSVNISATSVGVDSVINVVRYIDLIKQTYKGVGSLPVIASKYDVGGEFYDQFCFNGNLIRQFTDKPFYSDLAEVNEQLFELAADYQICKDKIYIGQYNDHYANVDLGGFLENPDKDYNIEKNDDYLINKFSYQYELYEKDRDEDNTLDAIHTDTEWYIPAIQSQNEKTIKLPYARDPYYIEVARRRTTEKQTTSESSDDKIMIVDGIRLAPNTRRNITRLLDYSAVVGGDLKFISDSSFSWNLLGFSVGDVISIDDGIVILNYTVTEITATILTVPYSGVVTETATALFTIDYPLTGVTWTNRTNQGLILAQNLLNPENFSNLRYSIKRNLSHWSSYIATAGKFIPSKEFKNSYFKANGEAKTQFTGEADPITENANIPFVDIAEDKIINQNLINTTVVASFEKVKTLIDNLQRINPDSSIGGFVRIQKQNGSIAKGYIKKLDHLWKYNELTLTLEEKNESDFLDIVYNGVILTINEVGYDIKTVTQRRFNVFNEKIQFFDENNINLCNRTAYSNVRFNGVVYNSVEELVIAIMN